jgi:hypothetical protein
MKLGVNKLLCKIIFLHVLLWHSNLFSQVPGRDNIWMLRDLPTPTDTAIGIDFTTGQPDTFSLSRSMSFTLSNASICDSVGHLLFYTNGCYVANSQHQMIMGTNGFNPGYETSYDFRGSLILQSTLILPWPNKSSVYCIIHMSADTFTIGNNYFEVPINLRYSAIDMTLDNGLGGFTNVKNQIVVDDTLVLGRLTACKHANGRDWWILAHQLMTNRYYELLLSPDTVLVYRTQDIGDSISSGIAIGTAIFSRDGSRFAYCNGDSILNIFNFDRCRGELTNRLSVYLNDTLDLALTGCAFSPSGRYLYLSNNFHVFQLDMNANDIAASKIIVGTWDSTYTPGTATFFYMVLGPDNKIYLSTWGGLAYFNVINNPDSAGAACNFVQRGLPLPFLGVHSMNNAPNYSLGPLTGTICDSLSNGIEVIANKNSALTVYPNPAISTITLSCDQQLSKNNFIVIYDFLGKEVFSGQNIIGNSFEINISDFSTGVYTVIVQNSSRQVIGKFVKE